MLRKNKTNSTVNSLSNLQAIFFRWYILGRVNDSKDNVMYKILVAEDDVYLREAYVTILVSAGYTVQAVENGRQALEAIEEALPDVMLLDMLMPVMGGLELLEEMSGKALLEKVRIIAFTNLSDMTTIDRLESYNVERYLLKSSVMPKELISTIEAVMKPESTV